MRNWINLCESSLAEDVVHFVPDVGTVIQIDDPYQWNDGNGLTKGKRSHVVKSWMKAVPEPKYDLDNEEDFDSFIDDSINNPNSDFLGDILKSSARRFNDNKRLMWCTREEAEYLSCGTATIKVGDGKVVGTAEWSTEVYDRVRNLALSYVGRVLY